MNSFLGLPSFHNSPFSFQPSRSSSQCSQQNYLKDKPPKDALVKLRVELLKILEIGEVAMMYRTKYTVNLEWLDPRITFFNLHGDQNLNSLLEAEKQMIWTPSLIFSNTDENT